MAAGSGPVDAAVALAYLTDAALPAIASLLDVRRFRLEAASLCERGAALAVEASDVTRWAELTVSRVEYMCDVHDWTGGRAVASSFLEDAASSAGVPAGRVARMLHQCGRIDAAMDRPVDACLALFDRALELSSGDADGAGQVQRDKVAALCRRGPCDAARSIVAAMGSAVDESLASVRA